MKIVFMGSPDFAVPGLQKLQESPHEVSAVVSGVDKRRGRGKATSPTPVKKKAIELGLPVIDANDLNSPELIRQLTELQPDLFVVVAFRILPKSLLAIPEIGSINLHASLLPKYRGAAPIHRAVMQGEKLTGCTVFFLDEKVDTGQILAQQELSVDPNETTGSVYERMMITGADLLLDCINKIGEGHYSLRPQNETEATPAPKIFADDCLINFNRSAGQVHNFIRGLSPYPAARVYLDGKLFKIILSRSHPDKNLLPYELQIEKESVFVGCCPGAVSLETVQMEGKPISSAIDFFRGYTGPGTLAGKKPE